MCITLFFFSDGDCIIPVNTHLRVCRIDLLVSCMITRICLPRRENKSKFSEQIQDADLILNCAFNTTPCV